MNSPTRQAGSAPPRIASMRPTIAAPTVIPPARRHPADMPGRRNAEGESGLRVGQEEESLERLLPGPLPGDRAALLQPKQFCNNYACQRSTKPGPSEAPETSRAGLPRPTLPAPRFARGLLKACPLVAACPSGQARRAGAGETPPGLGHLAEARAPPARNHASRSRWTMHRGRQDVLPGSESVHDARVKATRWCGRPSQGCQAIRRSRARWRPQPPPCGGGPRSGGHQGGRCTGPDEKEGAAVRRGGREDRPRDARGHKGEAQGIPGEPPGPNAHRAASPAFRARDSRRRVLRSSSLSH